METPAAHLRLAVGRAGIGRRRNLGLLGLGLGAFALVQLGGGDDVLDDSGVAGEFVAGAGLVFGAGFGDDGFEDVGLGGGGNWSA